MLYIISTSPYSSDFDSLINLLVEQDEVLLLQDGVLIGNKGILANDNDYLVQLRDKGIHIFALRDDIEAMGLISNISSYICQISYIDFVSLTVKHTQCFTW